MYLDADIRLIAKTNVGSLTSLDDPDVAEATGQWSKMAPILGIRGIFGSLPDRDESRHLLADRLKPPSLPPLEKCIDLYKAIGFTTVCGDGIDYSASASKPVNPTLRQTVRTFADPASVDKAINHAFGQEAPGSVLVNDGGHYVFNSDFRTQDAISVTYNADMIPLETLLQGLRDAKLNGDWYLPTTLSVSLQFYSRPSSPILRRILVGAAHISHNDSGVGDVEVVLWDDRTEQLVATGRQTLHMMKAPRAALDALTGKPKKKSVNENGRVGIQGGNAASRL